ncbi:MAG: hypothetical protein HQK53_00935 [Oligoflexia bacterium]|nr:hypothetical protein [Oligoflexia bacterium]
MPIKKIYQDLGLNAAFSRVQVLFESLVPAIYSVNSFSHKLIGFDIFDKFPETNFEDAKKYRDNFVQAASEQSISKEQLLKVLRKKGIDKNVELIEGNVVKSVPEYLEKNPHTRISLLNLDTDIYEAAVPILKYLWPKIFTERILVLDDYGTFPGKNKAVDEYFRNQHVKILKFPFVMTPCYIIKE